MEGVKGNLMGSFEMDINKFVAKCTNNTNAAIRHVLLEIGASVVNRTPVGNPELWQKPDNKPEGYVGGHARANWSYSVGSPTLVEYDSIDGNTWEGENISKIRIMQDLPQDLGGKVHYIQNSVPYIEALEDGHSQQTGGGPNGIVGLTVTEYQDYIQRALAEVK